VTAAELEEEEKAALEKGEDEGKAKPAARKAGARGKAKRTGKPTPSTKGKSKASDETEEE
jgi:hypothetical protein